MKDIWVCIQAPTVETFTLCCICVGFLVAFSVAPSLTAFWGRSNSEVYRNGTSLTATSVCWIFITTLKSPTSLGRGIADQYARGVACLTSDVTCNLVGRPLPKVVFTGPLVEIAQLSGTAGTCSKAATELKKEQMKMKMDEYLQHRNNTEMNSETQTAELQ